jgi:smad nuclear-interacting protein 1
VRDDDDDDHRRDDNNGNKRRRRWGDRDGEGTAPASSSSDAADNNDATTIAEREEENPNKVKANFALSGALASDVQTGNSRQGVTLKFSEPPEARVPNTRWRLYVFRKKDASTKADDDGLIDTYHLSKQSSYLFGRERKVADVPIDHPSLSKQHAVLQYRALPSSGGEERGIGKPAKLLCRPYLMDLESTNGTFVNGIRLDPARYYELRRGDVITFGASTREYVLLTEQSAKTGI